MTGRIRTERKGDIGRIVISNPAKRNAMSLEMWRALGEAARGLGSDPSIRAVILSGDGGNAFVSGADISQFESERTSADAVAEYNATTDRVEGALASVPVPTIAAIEGFCFGGGMVIALSCDMRVCGRSALFSIPAARLGLGYGYESARRLSATIGQSYAREMLFTARRFMADEAIRMGLVTRVVDDAAVLDAAREIAATIAANAPLTVRAAKFVLQQCELSEDRRDLDEIAKRVEACYRSGDYAEGRRAFLEKRSPSFTGR